MDILAHAYAQCRSNKGEPLIFGDQLRIEGPMWSVFPFSLIPTVNCTSAPPQPIFWARRSSMSSPPSFPALVAAGERASYRFFEFFTVNIRRKQS